MALQYFTVKVAPEKYVVSLTEDRGTPEASQICKAYSQSAVLSAPHGVSVLQKCNLLKAYFDGRQVNKNTISSTIY